MSRKNEIKLILHCACPLGAGAIIYYLLFPNVTFVKGLDRLLGHSWHFCIAEDGVQIIRFYAFDMLWSYALVFALCLIIGNNIVNLRRIFFILFTFSTFMEILQLTSLAAGTFDLLDIFFEFLAELFAVFIIKNYFLEEEKG